VGARRRRRARIFADVDVKHASPLAPYDLGQMAEDTFRRGRADVLLVTGAAPAARPPTTTCGGARGGARSAVLVASGVTDRTVARALREAHGALVGSWLKRDGRVAAPVDRERVRALVEAAKG